MAIHFNADKDPYADFLKAKQQAQKNAGKIKSEYEAESAKQRAKAKKKNTPQGADGNEGAAKPKKTKGGAGSKSKPIQITGYKSQDFNAHQGIPSSGGTYHPL